MSEQTEIPIPCPPASLRLRCAWCGDPATSKFEVEPPIWGATKGGTRVMKRRAIEADACLNCYKRLVHQPGP